jgi:hypothetical protein
MPSRKTRSKRSTKRVKGGLFGRLTSVLSGQGASAQTYCCDSKSSDLNVIGDQNVGKKCKPSYTGQCNIGYGTGQNYKFRCFNPKNKDAREEIVEGEENGEKCEYISGTLAKVAKVGVGSAKVAHGIGKTIVNNPLSAAILGNSLGGKSRRRKQRRLSKRRSQRSRK